MYVNSLKLSPRMSIRDVISVSAYSTQEERNVNEKAAETAKLNSLQLLNDGTAAALNDEVTVFEIGFDRTLGGL
ncbi:hypothetical protein ANCDUO_07883 [Ancylostoma duodenale]|uniref:Uncharacterized protein n=1 Tax=Ancylostoma duodenale TaxID=51022 RepID=A0A0C2CXU7_9BILA|nr:hypothetical protein ANCDUO_07883 [Ancylostoma duodenale]